MKFTPHDYQRRAIEFIEEHPAAGLFLEMGLGKTAITLTAAADLLDRFEVYRVLVIAPLRVAEDTWSREADKWDHLSGLRISKILGDAKARRAGLAAAADVYVINRENVVWLCEELAKQKRRWPFDMVIIDELSSFKSPQAKRFKALRKVRPFMDRIIGLTGTPSANGLMDLWAEMYLLDRGERLGPTITGYRSEYFRAGWSNGAIVYKWEPRKGAQEAITKAISDITVAMRSEDYLQLPARIDSTISVQLNAAELKKYKTMERDALIELEGEEITALNAAAVMGKLQQMANGFIYTEDHESVKLHSAKLEALDEIIEQADGPVLVYYSFKADKEALLEHYKQARQLEGPEDIAAWNEGRVPLLIAHPASVAYGLNLQEGGHVVAWYGLTWSLELYSQANARLHRQGQTRPVLVYHITAAGTVDEQVLQRIEQKDTSQRALLEILKERRGDK